MGDEFDDFDMDGLIEEDEAMMGQEGKIAGAVYGARGSHK